MSCDWDVFCIDCQDRLGINDANHDEKTMRELIAMRSALEAVGGLGLEITYSFRHFDVDWFKKHAGHRLAPRNEYGRLDDQCSASVRCPRCGTSHDCQLREKHEGAHEDRWSLETVRR